MFSTSIGLGVFFRAQTRAQTRARQQARSAAAAALALLSVFSAAGNAAECPDPPDEPGVTAICGIAGPEDIVLYDERALIVSSMTSLPHLYGVELATDRVAPLETILSEPSDGLRWGDASCAPPSALHSHGLDLSRRPDGLWQLLVVNHAARESIEYFAVQDSDGVLPILRWRGCVMAQDNAQFNDVAALPDGGFIVTDPVTASWQALRSLLGSWGMDTGRAYRWHPQRGYSPLAHTEGAYPNGITLSPDGTRFYLNIYLGGEVREHDLETGEILRRVAVEGGDNSSLSSDGRLLVAAQHGSFLDLAAAIGDPADVRNDIPYDIVAIDLESFETEVLYSSNGDSLGGGTVAQQVGSDLYIGAFRGDRMLRVKNVIPASP
jgi:hypothetical protein